MSIKIDYSEYSDFLICPKCGGDLDFAGERIQCLSDVCQKRFFYEAGIPCLLHEETGLISVQEFAAFYDKPEAIRSMHLHLGNNAASRRMYLVEYILNKEKPKSYLEISTGGGITAGIAIREGADLVFSVDISIEALKNGREKFDNRFIPIKADARFLPFKDKSVDFVLNCNLIEHLDAWDKCLKKSLSIAKKAVVISTDTRSLSSALNFAPFGKHPAGHLHVFNHYELKQLFSFYGEVRKTLVYTFVPYHILTKIMNLLLRTNSYGVGRGKKVIPAIPRYLVPDTEYKLCFSRQGLRLLKKKLKLNLSRAINSLYNALEDDRVWQWYLQKSDYPLAAFYIVELADDRVGCAKSL